MARPLLKSELKAQRSRDYLMGQRASLIERHGEDLGAFYFLVMLVQTHGKKALKRGDVAGLRALAHDLHAVYVKHTQ
ncbi:MULTISPECIES: carbohydrate ABC transporter [Streptomyces]|uniref:carbohydrate ABC transporter n=1 Tax=Streptomyces TaxID=1883 RepID=UPI0011810722|nr:carbohydrate ABC transporter [Streptomyces sp. IB201691-2A2]TRO56221.1 carbohydrate ABC transporter [Streptomyces sp. IB201691-2A2]